METSEKTVIESSLYSNSLVRLSMTLFYYVQGLCFGSWASRIPDFKSSLKLSDAELGSVLLALPVGQLVTMPFSGRIIKAVGSRKMLILTAPLYGLALSLVGFSTQCWHLVSFLFLFGVAGNFSNISLNTHGVSTESYYGKSIMTSFHGAWSLGGISAALIGLVLVNLRVEPAVHFVMIALLSWTHVFINYRFLITATVPKDFKKPKRFSLPNKDLMKLGTIAFCCMAVEGTMFDWSGVYFKEVLKTPESLVILGYTSFMVMMATGRFFGDSLVSRFGRKKMLRLSGLVIFVGMMISVLMPYITSSALGFMIVGFGVSSVVPMVYSLAGKSTAVSPSVALTVVSGVGFFGFLMGPPLIGYISELSNLKFSFAFMGCLGLFITVLSLVQRSNALK